MGFPRQEAWSGLPFATPGYVLTQGSIPCLLHCGHSSRLSLQWSPFSLDKLLLLTPPTISLSSFPSLQAIGTCAVSPLLIPWFLLALCCEASLPRPLEAALKSVPGTSWAVQWLRLHLPLQGLLWPPPGDLPHPGTESWLAGGIFTTGAS